MHAMHINKVFVEEGVSGSIPVQERPAGTAVFAKLAESDAIISPKLDRCKF